MMNQHAAKRFATEAGGDTPDALARVLADMLTTLGPEWVSAMRSALGAAPQTASYALHSTTPTRGATGVPLLTGHEREQMDEGMGMGNGKPKPPERLSDGRFVIHTMRPSDVRRLAAQGKF